jgi:hypothetical protein
MIRLLSYIAIGCFLCISHASAADTNVQGIGLRTCGEFASDYRVSPTNENLYFAWASGFISGINAAYLMVSVTAKNTASMSIDDEKQAIRQYCNDHPLAPYYAAVSDLFGRLSNSEFHFPQPPK